MYTSAARTFSSAWTNERNTVTGTQRSTDTTLRMAARRRSVWKSRSPVRATCEAIQGSNLSRSGLRVSPWLGLARGLG